MIRKILIVICLIVFCGSGAYILKHVLDNTSAEKTLEQVAQVKEKEDGNGLKDVYAENNHTVGWIEVEGTKIDYPVMQTGNATSEPDPEFYLHHDFNKESAASGTPFVDEVSIIEKATVLRDAGDAGGVPVGNGYAVDYSTWNWLIYGHHMKFGTMFHDLLEFESKDFWKNHKTFEFDRIVLGEKDGELTVSEVDEEYEIIAAGYSQIYPKDSDAFKYYEYAGWFDEESFNDFIAGIKAEACYDTGVTAEYGDQLVTMSTCAYQTEDGRFYVVGKRIK